MTWQARLISAAAAARRLATGSARRWASPTEAGSGPAATIKTQPESGTAQPTTPDLTARAVRTRNRKQEAVEAYLRVHTILGRKG